MKEQKVRKYEENRRTRERKAFQKIRKNVDNMKYRELCALYNEISSMIAYENFSISDDNDWLVEALETFKCLYNKKVRYHTQHHKWYHCVLFFKLEKLFYSLTMTPNKEFLLFMKYE